MLTLMNLVLLSILVGKSVSSTPACGVRGTDVSANVVGGETAGALEFPWQISLHLIELPNKDRGHICGGSIINSQYVDTAAHCIVDGYKSPSNYIVVVGEQNLNATDPHEERIAVINITIHPQWNPSTLSYDYALLKLERPLDFAGTEKALMPICLPTLNQGFDWKTCTISGWGLLEDQSQGGTVSQSLQKVDLPVIPNWLCSLEYLGVNTVVQDTMICAGPLAGGKGPCQGDSGGPLQCPRSDGRYVLAGSTSWGTTCAAAFQPGVFGRISTQVDWIKSVVGPTP
ncbi:unnamed protein product [Ixodes persulcatus]